MISIDSESIKRVENGDRIVRGNRYEILKDNYEDGWYVLNNFRDKEELEVERSGLQNNLSSGTRLKRTLPYGELIENDWYILEPNDIN